MVFRGVITLAVLLAIALGTFLYFRIDDEAHRLCETALNRYCQPFRAHVGAARFVPGRGVTMHDVQIVEETPFGPSRGVMQVEELVVEGDFDLRALLRGKPTVRRVVAKTPRLAATKLRDGTWNLARLKPPPTSGDRPPTIELRDATILLATERGNPEHTIGLRHVNATVAPSAESPGRMAITVAASNTLAGRLELRGEATEDGSAYDFQYRAEGLEVTSKLFAAINRYSPRRAPPLPVSGRVSAAGSVASTGVGAPLVWDAAFSVVQGRYRLPGVERPLTEVELTGAADPDGLRIDSGSARWGDARVRMAGRRNGWSLFAPLAMRGRIEDYDLASTPVSLLPDEAARAWGRFRPRGRAEIDVEVGYDGARWAPRATFTLRDASFEDREKFPYRVVGGAGTLRVNGGASNEPIVAPETRGSRIEASLNALADGAPITITADLREVGKPRAPSQPRPLMPMGWVEVTGTGVPISDRLVNAVPEPGARDFIHKLHPAGRIDVRWRAERSDPEKREPDLALNLRLVDCRVNYDDFPYPLSGVTGWVQQRGKKWDFYELRSRDTRGRTVVSGKGSLDQIEGGCRFDLRLTGEATPLDQTLYDALRSDPQAAWTTLRPRGQIDFVADITRSAGQGEPAVRLTMRPHQRNLTIEPPLSESGYRYRLERLDGDFEWASGLLTMRNVRATHGRTNYATDGSWESQPDGGWKLDLQGLHADRLEFNREFLLAAPAGLRSAIEDLQPRGGIDLFDSRLEVKQTAGPTRAVTARWRMGLNCHQAAINSGVPLEGISGVVRLSGASDGVQGTTAGELDLDSLFWNDLQLTNIRGPLWVDQTDCFLGEGAARKLQTTEPRPVTAKAYGGDVRLTSWVRHGGQQRYGVAVGMAGVDVRRLSSEWLGRPETLQGSLDGRLELRGSGATTYGLTGAGEMVVNDADLYELPFFLSLLKYLRNRTPDNTAFNQLDTKFTIEGEDIQFEKFNLLGDAVSLYGKGRATPGRDVDMSFASLVGRNEGTIPILRSFVSSASEQLMRLHVHGPIDGPSITREMLPAVSNVLEQLQGDFGPRETAGVPSPPVPARRY